MRTESATGRVLHVSDSADDSQLLAAELAENLDLITVTRVETRASLKRELESQPIDAIIADLPLPWERAHDDIAELQRTRPEIEVIFRWGEPGAHMAEAEDAQISRLLLRRLELRPTRQQDEGERRAMLRELARRQEVLLRIQRRPMWNFECVLRDTTRAVSELLDIERVSVWEFSRDHSRLECAMLYVRSLDSFQSGDVITSHPRYFQALESSLSIAAHDSIHDPRTSEFAHEYLEPLGIPSMLDAPIRLEGEVVGVLCLEQVGEPRHWSILDQCAASTLACHLARAFEVRRRRIAEQRVQALEHLDALGRIAGQIAHDFNNRLTVLRGWTELLEMDSDPGSSAGHAISELGSELDKATAHVRELLTLGQNGCDSTPAAVELADVIRRHSLAMRRVLGTDIELDFSAPQEAVHVQLDLHRLESILLNLCSNARDALVEGGRVRVSIETGVPSRGSERLVRLVFEDNGPGFSSEALEHLFEPLFTTKTSRRGSGLGLASIQRVVRDAGGEVRAANRKPRGARIEIDLVHTR